MPIILRSTAERLPYEHDGVTIFYHRLTYTERAEVIHLAQTRGEVDMSAVWLETAQRAIDGWDDQVVDADFHPIPVPHRAINVVQGVDANFRPLEDHRRQIAAIVSYFPPVVIERIGMLALEDTPDFLLDAWRKLWPENSGLPVDGPAMSLPASIVAPSEPTMP